MSFEDLPPLPPMIHPEAAGYAERAMALTRQAQADVRVAIDLRFGDDYWQKLDVYMPADRGATQLPVLVFFHGGAWTNGTKEWMGFMAPPLLTLPSVFVAANYRLAPQCRHPGPVEDCCDAIAWISRNIANFGGDPDRLFVGGHSAGGHLAALSVLGRERLALRGVGADAIKACFPVSGSFDLRQRTAQPGSLERRVYEVLLARDSDDADASPILHLSGTKVPFYLAWGERDFPRLANQGEAMVEALKKENVVVRRDVLAGFDHFEANLPGSIDPRGPWLATVRDWMTGQINSGSQQ